MKGRKGQQQASEISLAILIPSMSCGHIRANITKREVVSGATIFDWHIRANTTKLEVVSGATISDWHIRANITKLEVVSGATIALSPIEEQAPGTHERVVTISGGMAEVSGGAEAVLENIYEDPECQ
ncbi:hypothetical protein T484DRAFT_1787278, partial [Baffinella frigidus]